MTRNSEIPEYFYCIYYVMEKNVQQVLHQRADTVTTYNTLCVRNSSVRYILESFSAYKGDADANMRIFYCC